MNTTQNKGHAVLRIIRIIVLILCTAAVLFGALLLILGGAERRRIAQAAEKYTAAEVKITETRFSDKSGDLLVVVLEPVREADPGDAEHDPHTRTLLGRTVATTGNRRLAVGDVLTMYYDPQNTDTRIVDFNTAMPTMLFGGSLAGGGLLTAAALLTVHAVRRRKSRQPAAVIKE